MTRLDGKVVVITGGTRGIGRALVRGAVERGAQVVCCARERGSFEDGPAAVFTRCDVSKEEDVEALFDFTLGKHGRVDAVVNCAGINKDDLLVTMETSDWDEVMAVNLTGAFLLCRRAVSEFISGEGGALVCIGSLSQYGATSQSSYAASKGGLHGLVRSVAKEYGHKGVRANLVVAGYVETEMTERVPEFAKEFLVQRCPMRRAAAPEEIAAAALFLCSERASFINGESLHVSGGLTDIPL